MILFPFGVLVGPITAEFGWPRATLAAAVVVSHMTGALAMPFTGVLMDRFGVRKVALPAICLFALVFAGIALLPGVPWLFIAFYALLGVIGAGHSTLTYARAVSAWFDRRRGLALGITLSGVGIGTALTPQVARILVADYGWRGAYVGLAVLLLVLALPAVAFLVRDRVRAPRDKAAAAAAAELAALIPGMRLGPALRGYHFWAIGIALFLVALAVNGTIAHVVPLLGDRGVSARTATAALSAAGLALIVGRILSGYCLDRLFAPFVSAGFFLVPLCGIALLGAGATDALAVCAAILLGIGIGAEVDIMAFLVGPLFRHRPLRRGLRHAARAFHLGLGHGAVAGRALVRSLPQLFRRPRRLRRDACRRERAGREPRALQVRVIFLGDQPMRRRYARFLRFCCM